MKSIGVAMYVLTVGYFGIMFGFPFLFVNEECGEGLAVWVFIAYAISALLAGVYEVISVKLIEKAIKQEKNHTLLNFNRWHVVELVMGQIARLDTFLDACFLVMLL